MGIIYILTNDSMPGIIKIGITEESIIDRMKSLDTTSIPTPFRFYYAIESTRHKEIEKLVHNAFNDCRVRPNREFFKIDPERVVAALKIAGGKEIIENDNMIDETGKIVDVINTMEEQIVKKDLIKKRINFIKLGIKVGSELKFTRNEEIKCIVRDEYRVEYKGELFSLSGLAKLLFSELGYNWKSFQGPKYFLYNEMTINQMYRKIVENEEE